MAKEQNSACQTQQGLRSPWNERESHKTAVEQVCVLLFKHYSDQI